MARATKRILTKEDLVLFQESESFNELVSFIDKLVDAVRDKPNSTLFTESKIIVALLRVLDQLDGFVTSAPAVFNPKSRFGNPAFRDFYVILEKNIEPMLRTIPEIPTDLVTPLSCYLLASFGDPTRIDYGSGHELNFVTFLFCLDRLDLFDSNTSDYMALVLRVFRTYLSKMRVLEETYYLEPAGSHGVWGLDDYHFLPFLFGASQLVSHPHLRPRSVRDPAVIQELSKEYMYLDCIRFIMQVKTEGVSMRWHSPMLDDISRTVRTWAKVTSGMRKMYLAEVLGKLPIMQHFLFCDKLFTVPEGLRPPRDDNGDGSVRHVHVHGEDGMEDLGCCGIPVPSAIGAQKSMLQSEGLRRVIPFD